MSWVNANKIDLPRKPLLLLLISRRVLCSGALNVSINQSRRILSGKSGGGRGAFNNCVTLQTVGVWPERDTLSCGKRLSNAHRHNVNVLLSNSIFLIFAVLVVIPLYGELRILTAFRATA